MSEIIKCPNCKTDYETTPDQCANCGYPFAAGDKEKSQFIARQIMKRGKIKDTRNSIRSARIILFIIASINIIFPVIISLTRPVHEITLVLGLITGLVFLVFGFTAKKYPFISVLIPLIFLVIVYGLSAIADPSSIMRGILWKIIFLSILIYSLVNIIQSEQIKSESKHLAEKDYK